MYSWRIADFQPYLLGHFLQQVLLLWKSFSALCSGPWKHQPPIYLSCLCPVRFVALISTAGCLRSLKLQRTPSSRTFARIWALHGFAEIQSKAVLCLSHLLCVDMTQHCTMPWLLSCPLVNQENKRILGFRSPSAEGACFPQCCWELLMPCTGPWSHKWQSEPPSSKNYISVWICQITLGARSQNSLKSLCRSVITWSL